MLVPSETGVSKDSLLDLGEKDLTIKLEIFFQKKKSLCVFAIMKLWIAIKNTNGPVLSSFF